MFRMLILGLLLLQGGCLLKHQHYVRNPYPQLSKIAVAPFFNLSTEPTVNGREFAEAYAAELQTVPGYEVAPVGLVEQTVLAHGLSLDSPADSRRLAQLLGVDAVVIGAVTDFSPYYPPRCSMLVEWYAANPYFHPIPSGYGLPFGTPQEENIPPPLVYEAEFELAQSKLNAQSPPYVTAQSGENMPPAMPVPPPEGDTEGRVLSHERPPESGKPRLRIVSYGESPTSINEVFKTQPSPVLGRTPRESMRPVMRHIAAYNGTDPDFTCALAGYFDVRDDERFGGWRAYLRRTDDFVRFCCHMHIFEMIGARGGASETRVVWQWPKYR